jgi:DHA1 family inner membrane transport protein
MIKNAVRAINRAVSRARQETLTAIQEPRGPDGHEPPLQGYRNTVVSGACLSIAWFGDSVIYIVLPLYAATFGFDAFMVGVLLSVNRVVRILGYGWVAPLAQRFGANMLTAAACLAAALTTIAYGMVASFTLFFIARCIWGGAWGILNLTMTAYAYGDGRGAGRRIGVARAASIAGPFATLLAVGYLCVNIGPHKMFVLYGVLSLFAVPLAFLLPPMRTQPKTDVVAAKRWIPTPLNTLFFGLAFAADGVLGTTISVLLSGFMPASSAIIGAGLIIAFQRLVGIILAFFSGPVTDRIGARRLLMPCTMLVVAGLAVIASGHVYSGAIIVIFSRGLLQTVGPVLAAERSPDRIAALASYSTWTDVGLAAGAFLGTVGVARIGYAPTYSLMAFALLLASAWQFMTTRRPAV